MKPTKQPGVQALSLRDHVTDENHGSLLPNLGDKCKFIIVSFFLFMVPVWAYTSFHVSADTRGGRLWSCLHFTNWRRVSHLDPALAYVTNQASRDSEHCGSRQASVCPTLMWVSRLWTQVLTLMPMKNSLPTEPFSQLQNYAGILLFLCHHKNIINRNTGKGETVGCVKV